MEHQFLLSIRIGREGPLVARSGPSTQVACPLSAKSGCYHFRTLLISETSYYVAALVIISLPLRY